MDRSELVRIDKRHVWHPYTQMDAYIADVDPIVVARAEGVYLEDMDGNRYLDGNASWWVSAFGHRHPKLVAALLAQAQTLPHAPLAGCTHAPAALLARELCAIAPGATDAKLPAERRLGRVFYSDDGSTAVELSIKAAAQYWAQNGRKGRTRFVSLGGAFHGETLGATSVSGLSLFRQVFGPLLFDVLHLPSPAEGGWAAAAERLEQILRTDGDEIAAVIVEPLLQGACGMQVHDPALLRAVRAATLAADTFLIADEVFTGLGRTGTTFACDGAAIVPDLLCLAKALSGGLIPFAATLASERIFAGFLGDKSRALHYGHSYCGNPLGAAVARAALALFREEDILGQVAQKAPLIAARFAHIAGLPGVLRTRSLGMTGALDLGGGGYLGGAGWRVYNEARRLGAYLRPLGDTVYIAPALTIPMADLSRLLDVVEASVVAAAMG